MTSAGRNRFTSPNRFTLTRAERLKSRRSIGLLFSEGSSIKHFPLRLIWRHEPSTDRVRATFSVGKSAFKRAIARNRIKRLLRETYRLQRAEFLGPKTGEETDASGSGLDLIILYTGRKMPDFAEIESAMKAILTNLSAEISKNG